MRIVNYNYFIEITIFLYIVSLYLLTYRDELNLISNALALLFIFLVCIKLLFQRKKIIINKFLMYYGVFIGICIFSSLYALDQDTSISRVRTLVLLYLLMFAFINYIDNIMKVKKILYYFIFAGFMASIYIGVTSDFSNLERFGSELGNLNAIGINIGISATFCFYFFLEKRKVWLLFIFLIMFTTILLTGSRSALLFILLSIVINFYLRNRKSIYGKIKFIVTSLLLIAISLFSVFNIPFLYQIIGSRIENISSFFSSGNADEGSLYIRADMLISGIEMFKNSPLLGYGIDNFGYLYNKSFGGLYTYSHNNFIELLVGIGVIGTILFYSIHFIVLKDLFKIKNSIKINSLNFLFIAFIISFIFLSISSVYYYGKHFSILFAISSVLGMIKKEELKE